MPGKSRRLDSDSTSDVMPHLRYTAVAQWAMAKRPSPLSVFVPSCRYDFANDRVAARAAQDSLDEPVIAGTGLRRLHPALDSQRHARARSGQTRIEPWIANGAGSHRFWAFKAQDAQGLASTSALTRQAGIGVSEWRHAIRPWLLASSFDGASASAGFGPVPAGGSLHDGTPVASHWTVARVPVPDSTCNLLHGHLTRSMQSGSLDS